MPACRSAMPSLKSTESEMVVVMKSCKRQAWRKRYKISNAAEWQTDAHHHQIRKQYDQPWLRRQWNSSCASWCLCFRRDVPGTRSTLYDIFPMMLMEYKSVPSTRQIHTDPYTFRPMALNGEAGEGSGWKEDPACFDWSTSWKKIRAVKNLCIGLSAVQELASPGTVTVIAVSR